VYSKSLIRARIRPPSRPEIFRLDFSGPGIFAFDPDPLPGGADRKVTAQLYCDKTVYTVPAAKIYPTQAAESVTKGRP
jgi:hypothetical protein